MEEGDGGGEFGFADGVEGEEVEVLEEPGAGWGEGGFVAVGVETCFLFFSFVSIWLFFWGGGEGWEDDILYC